MAKKQKDLAKDKKVETLKVGDTDRNKLLILSAELRAANAEYNLARVEFEGLMALLDKDGKLRAAIEKINATNMGRQLATQRYTACVKSIEETIGCSLDGLAMNPETGVVRPINAPEDTDKGVGLSTPV